MTERYVQYPFKRKMGMPAPVDSFLRELEELCVKHGMVVMKETVGPLVIAPITAAGLEDLVVNAHISRKFFQP